MSKRGYLFIESNLPSENFAGLPIVPIKLKTIEGSINDAVALGLIDTGSNKSFIDVSMAEDLKVIVSGNIVSSGISGTERKPSCKVLLTNEALDGNWIQLTVGIIDCRHPNITAILGRDFLDNFNSVTYNYKEQLVTLDFSRE